MRVLSRSLLLLAALFAARLSAQSAPVAVTLSGRVVDVDTKAGLPFLTLQLRTARDSAFVSGRLSSETGAFTFTGIKPGTYLLLTRAIGYQPIRQRVLVGELSTFLDLGLVTMRRETQALTGVTVTAEADGVAAALDRRTFTVADNVSQAGGSVLQAMSTVPGVTVSQEGTVQLRGSDKVAVLIDGKQTALTGFGSQTGLANLPASAIERIEIITNPSARFDANASAGVINLVLKKQEQRGFNGTVGFTGGAGALWEKRENLPTIRPQFRGTPKLNPSLALNYRSGATNSFLQADWLHSPTLNKNEFSTRTYDDGTVIIQQVKRNRRTDYGTLKAGVDHAFGNRNTLNVSGLFNREKIIDNGDNPYFDGSLQNRYRRWRLGDVSRDHSGRVRQLRRREPASRTRRRNAAGRHPTELRRESRPQHLPERRVRLSAALSERPRRLEDQRRAEAVALREPAGRPAQRGGHPHLSQVRRAGTDQGRQPRAAAAVRHVGGAGIQGQLDHWQPVRSDVPPDHHGHHHAHHHAGPGERAAVQRVSERRGERQHRVGARVAADAVAAPVARREREPVPSRGRGVLRREPVSHTNAVCHAAPVTHVGHAQGERRAAFAA
jgi:hypothetical protein